MQDLQKFQDIICEGFGDILHQLEPDSGEFQDIICEGFGVSLLQNEKPNDLFQDIICEGFGPRPQGREVGGSFISRHHM